MNMNVEETINKYKDKLGQNDFGFLNRVYQTNSKVYLNRLKNIGFENYNSVLDAGCGYGQWSISLSKLNSHVLATDISSSRVIIADDIAKSQNIKNIDYKQSDLTNIPLKDNSVDAVFSFGVIFLVNIKDALLEFHRVLNKGGRVYFNTNGLGWALNLWHNEPNKTDDYIPRETVVKSFKNTLLIENGNKKENGQQVSDKEDIIQLIENIGFKLIECDGDGLINITNNNNEIKPFFQKEYFGFEGVTEYLIERI